ncbi:MAG: TonB-dependent receptor plug domain-containing protein [Bacteroidia bacterium]|jgi:outer membrane cobalamin receptor|nr:TonB-dependent receptor plug domain-containing protein [Bacteroidia bacterium]
MRQVQPYLLLFVALFSWKSLYSQSETYKGKVVNKNTQKPLENVEVLNRFGSLLTKTTSDGVFTLEAVSVKTGEQIIFKLGDIQTSSTIDNTWKNKEVKIELDIKIERMKGVVIKQNRLKEKLKESALTVESMSAQSIKETPASDFYEALGHLKGVDVTAASLGFRIVNTRGFNSTSPVRTLQVIDGVDNQSPGLNFSLGNFLGASELDIASQEIVVGASSAFYGPGAFNGVISMTTKDIWKTPGFSYKFKVGERQLMENSLRYAKVFKDKKGKDVFAFKGNFLYMSAYDWVADNRDATYGSPVSENNPGGYDAVNRYGDEVLSPGEFDQSSVGGKEYYPGLDRYFRDGYWESDIVDYNTYNLKTSGTLAFKPFKDKSKEFIYQSNFGMGTTVYQGDNRYSLNDIKFFQNRLEFKHKKGFFRVYRTYEDAGNTYDAVFTSMLLLKDAKENYLWGGDYQKVWKDSFVNRVKSLEGFPNFRYFRAPDSFMNLYNQVIDRNRDQITQWHNECREIVNRGQYYTSAPSLNPALDRFMPGTDRFEQLKKEITSKKSFGEGGSGFFDQSALTNAQIEHHFKVAGNGKLSVGASGRLYQPNSAGTIFSDTNGRVITNHEFGLYTGFQKRYWKNKLKMNATFRTDKNVNFPFVYSPALSFVYNPDKITFYRLSLTSGVRNPTLADQYLYYNVGRAILLGNLYGYKNLVSLESLEDYFNQSILDLNRLKYFDVDPVVPEKVKSIEGGFKGFLFDNKLNIDWSAYFSYYQDFIGYKIGFDPIIEPNLNRIIGGQVYRVATNANSNVTTVGTSIGLNYFIGDQYTAGFNYSFNQLNKLDKDDPIIPAFNTPRNKFNVSFSGSQLEWFDKKHFSFNLNFKWIEGFLFEGSPQFTGFINSYYLLDAMIAKEIPEYNMQLKLGGSNLTNNMVMQVYGGPRIGRMVYFSILYDLPEN